MSRRSCSQKREENQEGVRAEGWVGGLAGAQALTPARLREFTQQHLTCGNAWSVPAVGLLLGGTKELALAKELNYPDSTDMGSWTGSWSPLGPRKPGRAGRVCVGRWKHGLGLVPSRCSVVDLFFLYQDLS